MSLGIIPGNRTQLYTGGEVGGAWPDGCKAMAGIGVGAWPAPTTCAGPGALGAGSSDGPPGCSPPGSHASAAGMCTRCAALGGWRLRVHQVWPVGSHGHMASSSCYSCHMLHQPSGCWTDLSRLDRTGGEVSVKVSMVASTGTLGKGERHPVCCGVAVGCQGVGLVHVRLVEPARKGPRGYWVAPRLVARAWCPVPARGTLRAFGWIAPPRHAACSDCLTWTGGTWPWPPGPFL